MCKKFAVIGLGNISKRHRRNLKKMFPDSLVIGMSAQQRVINNPVDSADVVVDDIAELLDINPEFVVVASPASLHIEHATQLMEAGVPCLIEKPLCVQPNEAAGLLGNTNLHDVKAAAGYCLRYMPSAQFIKTHLENQRLGTVHTVIAHVGQYLPDWRVDMDFRQSVSARPELGGGVLLELSHELDYLQWLFGSLQLNYSHLRNSRELDLAVEEIADVVLSNKYGTLISLHMDFLQATPSRWCRFIGDKGVIEWDLIQNKVTLQSEKGKQSYYEWNGWDSNQMYTSMLSDFWACIQGKEHSCVSIAEALSSVLLVQKIKNSAQWGIKQ